MPEETPYILQETCDTVEGSETSHVSEEDGNTVDIFSIHSENPTGSCPALMQ